MAATNPNPRYLLRQAHEMLDPDALAQADNAAELTQQAIALALVAIAIHLEGIAGSLELMAMRS
jgi:hypothetical protein